jgi:hypothetical protein
MVPPFSITASPVHARSTAIHSTTLPSTPESPKAVISPEGDHLVQVSALGER